MSTDDDNVLCMTSKYNKRCGMFSINKITNISGYILYIKCIIVPHSHMHFMYLVNQTIIERLQIEKVVKSSLKIGHYYELSGQCNSYRK